MRSFVLLSVIPWVGAPVPRTAGDAPAAPSLPILTPSTSGVYRLDDLLDQAEVEGPDLPLYEPDELTVHVVDCREDRGGFRPTRAAGLVRPAGLIAHDSFLRIRGVFGSTCQVALPPVPAEDLGMLILRVRAEEDQGLNLNLVGDPDPDATPTETSIAQQMAQMGVAGPTVPVPGDGEWHTLAQPLSDFTLAPGLEVTGLTLTLTSLSTAISHVDLEFVHFLEARAPFTHAVAGPATFERNGVARAGMFLNTPVTLSYRLRIPEKGRFLGQLMALNEDPFFFALEVQDDDGRHTVLETEVTSTDLVDLAADLSPWAGQEVTLNIDVVEDLEPVVAWLLHPTVLGARDPRHRNVLLYMCDTLRADALSCYGNSRPTTPVLDALAAEGVRFERCYAQSSWTYVSVPSALASIQPTGNGVRSFGDRLPESAVTLAEVFREAGYLTAAFSCNTLVGKTIGVEQGFDVFVDPPAVVGQADTWTPHGSPFLRELTLDLIDHAGGAPVFLYLHAVDPHAPYVPPAPHDTRYLTREEGDQFARDMEKANGSPLTPVVVANRDQMTAAGIDVDRFARAGRALYDAETGWFDHNVGLLLDGLRERGLTDDLVFSLNSDHGEEFLEHDATGHGQSLFGELVNVPWILHAPGMPEDGTVVTDNVSNLDLAPTLLSLAGLEVPPSMQGRDLRAALTGDAEILPVGIVTELHGLAGVPLGDGLEGRRFAIIEGPLKTVVRYGDPPPAQTLPGMPAQVNIPRPPIQLFHTVNDPLDQHDLYAQMEDRAMAARRRLEAFLEQQDQVRAVLGEAESGAMSAAAAALQALGYVR